MIQKKSYTQWVNRVRERVGSMKDIAFILHRNNNENMVCYNRDDKEVCKPFWVMFEKEGHPYEELTMIEKQFGYGLELINSEDDVYVMKIKAFDKKIIFTDKSGNGWEAYTMIQGALKKLVAVHLEIKKIIGIIPTVEYMEIFGGDGEYEKYVIN